MSEGLNDMPLVVLMFDAEILEANGLDDDAEEPVPQGSAEVREDVEAEAAKELDSDDGL